MENSDEVSDQLPQAHETRDEAFFGTLLKVVLGTYPRNFIYHYQKISQRIIYFFKPVT